MPDAGVCPSCSPQRNGGTRLNRLGLAWLARVPTRPHGAPPGQRGGREAEEESVRVTGHRGGGGAGGETGQRESKHTGTVEECGGGFLHRHQLGKNKDVSRHFCKFILERVVLSPVREKKKIALSGRSLAFLKLKSGSGRIATAV